MRATVDFNHDNKIWILRTDEPESFIYCKGCKKKLEGFRRGYFCKETKKMWCKNCELGNFEIPAINCGTREDEHTHFCISSIDRWDSKSIKPLLGILSLFSLGLITKIKGWI